MLQAVCKKNNKRSQVDSMLEGLPVIASSEIKKNACQS